MVAAQRLSSIKQLVDGFETPFGMELLLTVHWVATRECISNPTIEEIIKKVQYWNSRKEKLFQFHQINIAVIRLKERGWIE